MVYSSSAYTAYYDYGTTAYFFWKQLVFTIGSFAFMIVVSKIDYHTVLKFSPLFYISSIILMCLVNFTGLGKEVNGKKRWLRIGGIQFQPTEFVKIAMILMLTVLMVNFIKEIDKLKVNFILLVVLAIPTVLVLKNNLSSGIIVFGIGIVMYFIASRRTKFFAVSAIAVVLVLVLARAFPEVIQKLLQGYQASRIQVWINPMSDPSGKGYQVLQGLYAIGSGGLLGKGLGNSIQKLGFLPESYNDMVFSVVCEELGLFGAIAIIVLFIYLIERLVYIAHRAKDLTGMLIVSGVMAHIAIQVILNIAVVTNTLPNTGVTLPFISYGGTSVIFLMAEIGLVLNVSNQIIYKK
ncbi:Cell division protein FtsW [Lachnospiraceae bacterium TWA4]|nr:Cell division protein FtsW [Lachnospiraceae bacterium TWA4]